MVHLERCQLFGSKAGREAGGESTGGLFDADESSRDSQRLFSQLLMFHCVSGEAPEIFCLFCRLCLNSCMLIYGPVSCGCWIIERSSLHFDNVLIVSDQNTGIQHSFSFNFKHV